MVNYKPQQQDVITIASRTNVLKTNQKYVALHSVGANADAPNSFENLLTQADYVVPAGKTFTAIGIRVINDAGAGLQEIFEGDTANAITTLKFEFIPPAVAKGYYEFECSFTIASGKYITLDASAVSILFTVILIGYET